MRQWLTPTQVSEMTGVAVQTLANWRSLSRTSSQPLGPQYVKAGRLVRYWSDEVAAWMEQQR